MKENKNDELESSAKEILGPEHDVRNPHRSVSGYLGKIALLGRWNVVFSFNLHSMAIHILLNFSN
jgi:hypothetical protein